jgi:hypothetical protein
MIEKPVDLVETVDAAAKKQKTGPSTANAGGSAMDAKRAVDEAATKDGAVKGSADRVGFHEEGDWRVEERGH